MTEEAPCPFDPSDFMRQDDSDDGLFYEYPRLVVHIDDQAIEAVRELFREVIPPNSMVLDLMSSWRSHWPGGHPRAGLVGLGLNAVEMDENPDLDSYVVHDLNKDPRLPFEDASFDAAVISVSIQYLTRPIEVFRDVNRILKPGGIFLVIFSNRMFPTKAVRAWTMRDDEERMYLVGAYFHYAGNYAGLRGTSRNLDRDLYQDPVYVVMAQKESPGTAL